ncbi:MAG: hypothetical protein RLZZ450_1267 [Pseudomonadota bacterium]|jgi:hypothetical protein
MMTPDETQRTVLLTLAELEALHALVTAKIEGVLVHSQEYFRLEDIAHKLLVASKSPR